MLFMSCTTKLQIDIANVIITCTYGYIHKKNILDNGKTIGKTTSMYCRALRRRNLWDCWWRFMTFNLSRYGSQRHGYCIMEVTWFHVVKICCAVRNESAWLHDADGGSGWRWQVAVQVVVLAVTIPRLARREDLIATAHCAVVHFFRVRFLQMFFQDQVVPEP